ncbi:UNC93-like protein [Caerostris extrusa]|uniref:UNC93-like protein n=1 Tax=Caerostris extrusa TaxID=172846 RepID=A0AAV4XRW4_CAEEX|nr:UNC93-like protein [Caerostris extrusa]
MELEGAKKKEFSKLRVIKNLILISMSFLFTFTAYNALTMLQSTMNKAEGIGVISQAAIFTVQGLSSLFLSSYVLKKLGAKVSLIIGMGIFVPYISANFYPAWIIMIPSAMLRGLGAAFMWGAHGTYINECSKLYCALDEKDNTTKLSKRLKKPGSKLTNTEIPPEIGEANMQSNTLQENGITCSCKQDKLSTNVNGEPHYCLEVNRKETGKFSRSTKTTSSHRDDVSQSSKNANGRIDERCFSQLDDKKSDNKKNEESVSSIDNINAIFFGFNNLLFASAQITEIYCHSMLYVQTVKETLNNLHNCSCGADYCNTDSDCFSKETEEVSNNARYLLTGICVVLAGMSVLLNLFLDRLNEKKGTVTFSWAHAFCYCQIQHKEKNRSF